MGDFVDVLPLIAGHLHINELPALRLVCKSWAAYIDDEANGVIQWSAGLVFPAHWDCRPGRRSCPPLSVTLRGGVDQGSRLSLPRRKLPQAERSHLTELPQATTGGRQDAGDQQRYFESSALTPPFFQRVLSLNALPNLGHLIIFSEHSSFLCLRLLKQLLTLVAPSLRTLEFLEWLFNVDYESLRDDDQSSDVPLVFPSLKRLFFSSRASSISTDRHLVCGLLRGCYFPACEELWLTDGRGLEDDTMAFLAVMPKLRFLSLSHCGGDGVSGILRRLATENPQHAPKLRHIHVETAQHPRTSLRLTELLQEQQQPSVGRPLPLGGGGGQRGCRFERFCLTWSEGVVEDVVYTPKQIETLFPGCTCTLEGRVLLSPNVSGVFDPAQAEPAETTRRISCLEGASGIGLERVTFEAPPLSMSFDLSDCKVWGHLSSTHTARLLLYKDLIGVGDATGLPTIELTDVWHCARDRENGKTVISLLERVGKPGRPFVLQIPHPLDRRWVALLSEIIILPGCNIVGLDIQPAEACRGRQSYGEWLLSLAKVCTRAANKLRILRLGLLECSYGWTLEDDFDRARQKCVIGEVLQMLPAVRVVETRRYPATYQIGRFEWMQSCLRTEVPPHWRSALSSRGFRRIDKRSDQESTFPLAKHLGLFAIFERYPSSIS